MQPPSMPHTMSRTTASEMARSSARERMLTRAAAVTDSPAQLVDGDGADQPPRSSPSRRAHTGSN